MKFFGDDPLRGFLSYFVVTLLLCYLARWFYRRRTQANGVPGALSKKLYISALLISPIVAYQLVNIDDTYGYYRYFKPACDKDGGDYIAERLEKIESIAVHPIGLPWGGSGDILDYALDYSRDSVGQNFSFIEFQFDSAMLTEAENAEAFYMYNEPHRLTMDGQAVGPGFYRVENLCRSSAPNAWQAMNRNCFRGRKVVSLDSPYFVDHQMRQCDIYSGMFRLCSMRWQLTRRADNKVLARAVAYAYAGGWRTQITYPNDPKSHGYSRHFTYCGSKFVSYGLLKKILER